MPASSTLHPEHPPTPPAAPARTASARGLRPAEAAAPGPITTSVWELYELCCEGEAPPAMCSSSQQQQCSCGAAATTVWHLYDDNEDLWAGAAAAMPASPAALQLGTCCCDSSAASVWALYESDAPAVAEPRCTRCKPPSQALPTVWHLYG